MRTPVPLATIVLVCKLPPVSDQPFPALLIVDRPATDVTDPTRGAVNSKFVVVADRIESETENVSPTTDAVL
jgi:hypothetical protein